MADLVEQATDLTDRYTEQAIAYALNSRSCNMTYLGQGMATPPGESHDAVIVVVNRAPVSKEEREAAIRLAGLDFTQRGSSYFTLDSDQQEILVVSEESVLGKKVRKAQ
jgi:hypothetical protein